MAMVCVELPHGEWRRVRVKMKTKMEMKMKMERMRKGNVHCNKVQQNVTPFSVDVSRL